MSSLPSFPTLSYDLLDVFTLDPCKPFTGNPLAVVYGTEGLAQDQLQKIALEFNLSETTFPSLPSEEEKAKGIDYNVRIFTVEEELPFAGHPTLGTCFSLLSRSLIPPPPSPTTKIIQSCPSGLISLLVSSSPSLVHLSSPHKYISPAQLALPSSFLSIFSLPETTRTGIIRVSSCGLPFLFVQVEDEQALAEAKANGEGVRRMIEELKVKEKESVQGVLMFYVERIEGGEEGTVNVRVHDRMLYTQPGEDPATGSANIALGPVLLQTPSLNLPPDFTGTLNYTVAQGLEMGCPSQLFGRVVSEKGEVKECWIGGGVVKVGEGWIRVPEA
ncbi:hypothetical protein BDY24DRAFT_118973 [Mrakia frigida]|uniref:Yhi9p n=1 Tax=Mrakia frigida TaxID=29902 RepID=UPI003FCC003B